MNKLQGMYVNTITRIKPSVDIKQQTGMKLKDIPDVLMVASKSKGDARKQKQLLIRKYKLKTSGDSIVNFIDMIELTTNY